MKMSRRRRRKKQWKRVLLVLGLSVLMAVLLVFVRSCSENMPDSYNKDYRPMDVQRMQGASH